MNMERDPTKFQVLPEDFMFSDEAEEPKKSEEE
jgi:hypothetical protein